MFCPFCGFQLTDGSAFCPNCGNKLSAAEPAQPASAPQSTDGFQSPEAGLSGAAQPSAPVWNDPYSNAGQAPAAPSQPAPVWNDPYSNAGQAPAAPSQPAPVWNNPYANAGTASGSYSAPASGSYSAPASGTYQPAAPQGGAGGQGPYSATQVPGYQGYPAQPAGGGSKPKKRTGLIIAAVALIAVVVLGFLGKSLLGGGSSAKKIDGLLQEASDAQSAGRYDEAISKYEEVLRLDKENEQAAAGLYDLYVDKMIDYYDDDDLENSVKYALLVKELDRPDSLVDDEYLEDLYSIWIYDLCFNGDTDKAAEVLRKAKPHLSQEAYDDMADTIEFYSTYDPGPSEQPVTVTDQQSFADRISQLVDAGDMNAAAQLVYDYQDLALTGISSGNRKTFRVSGRNYDNVEIVDDGSYYYIYYGDMNGSGERDGIGWVVTYLYGSDGDLQHYYYTTMWERGKANGAFREYVVSGENYGTTETYEGNLKDGLYEGRIRYINEDGDPYYGDFVDGIIQVPGRTEEGYRITWQSEDGAYYYYVTYEDEFNPLGVACY